MRSLWFLLVVVPVVAVLVGGCVSETASPEEDTETVAQPIGGGDCSDGLNTCYVTCQGEQPTPVESCFYGCDCAFYHCIEMPVSGCEGWRRTLILQ